MNTTAAERGWQLTGSYLLVLGLIVLVAKVISILLAARKGGDLFRVIAFMLSPSLSYSAWKSSVKGSSAEPRKILYCCPVVLTLAICLYCFVIPVLPVLPWWWQGYLTILPFWLFVEAIQAICQLVWLPFGIIVPPFNNSPWKAASVAEFWGRRWNLLFGDWLREVVFNPLQKRPVVAMCSAFFVSGLLHELLVSLPYQLVCSISIWGLMTIYFLMQFLAVILEKYFLPKNRVVGRIFVWIAVLLPAPLVLNPATLAIFHLVP